MSQTQPSTRRGVAVLFVLVVAIAGLHVVSRFGLSGPAGMSIESIREWVGEPVTAIATVARWLSLILAYYLAVVIGASLLLGDRFASSPFERFTPASVTGLIGLLLGTTAVVVPLAMHQTPETQALTEAVADHRVDAPLVLGQLDDPLVLGGTAGNENTGLLPAAASVDDAWTVQQGDSFWSIAEETLHDHSDAELTEEEIAEYWRTLIAANEDRLIEPDNPDLILPGQQLTLPPTAAS